MKKSDILDLIGNQKKTVVFDAAQVRNIQHLTSAFNNNGLVPVTTTVKSEDGKEDIVTPAIGKVSFKDVLSTKELYSLMPEVVTNILVDTIEPEATISQNLFQEVQVPPSTSFNFGQIGPLIAGEISELGEYPEAHFDSMEHGYRFRVGIKKYGLLMKVSDEVLRDDLLGIYAMFLRKAGQALVRKREAVCHDMIQRIGETVFDNAKPNESIYGSLAGRGIDGARNGTPTAHDVLQAFSRLIERGFTPDTIMMHPFAWSMFAFDPELKEMFGPASFIGFPGTTSRTNSQLNNPYLLNWNMTGNPTMNNQFQQQGSNTMPGQRSPWEDPLLMKLGPNPYAQTTGLTGANIAFNSPGYLPGPVKVLLSPYVRLQKLQNSWVSDVVFADSNEVGVIMRGSQPNTEEWREPQIDAQNLKIREEYGVGLLNQGKALNIMRNVVIDRNYMFDNVNSQILSPINRGSTINFNDGTA